MKIFLTSFVHDGVAYEGPSIFAENLEKATGIANAQGLFIDGEIVDTIETDKYLEESIMAFAIEQKERVLH